MDDTITTTATVTIPRSALTIVQAPPDTISQRTVEAVTGVPARTYLGHLRRPGFPVRVVRDGKLRIVARAAYVAWLLSLADKPEEPADDADAVLGELGLRLVAGSSR